MKRREFILGAAAQPAASSVSVPGSILVHEHILVDFIGAEKASRSRYDLAEVVRVALPKLDGGGRAAEAQIEILDAMRCPLEKFVWVHAQGEKAHLFHERAARAGAWVEFDGISESTADWHRECVLFMRKQGWLGKTLISQDSGWYRVGEPGGVRYRGYSFLYTDFLPMLPREIWGTLLVENPRNAFGA